MPTMSSNRHHPSHRMVNTIMIPFLLGVGCGFGLGVTWMALRAIWVIYKFQEDENEQIGN